MKTIRLAILFSGNGSNLENIYKKMQNLIINPCVSTPNLARFVVQKIGIKDAVVPSADFLLESEKRGSPPKSEKRQLLARRGSGAGGAALLRKETSESSAKSVDCFGDESPRNDKSIKLNFALAVSSNESAYGITRCANLGLKCEVVDYKQNKADFIPKIIALLEKNQIDLVVLAGFMRILPPAFNAKFRAINIHPSILPLFKGAHAIKESFESDMKIAGVSVHFVSDELDSGALIMQDIIHKIEGESLENFEARIHEVEYEIYPKAIVKAVQMITKDSL